MTENLTLHAYSTPNIFYVAYLTDEIGNYLSFKDIFSFQLVCRQLRKNINDREFWENKITLAKNGKLEKKVIYLFSKLVRKVKVAYPHLNILNLYLELLMKSAQMGCNEAICDAFKINIKDIYKPEYAITIKEEEIAYLGDIFFYKKISHPDSEIFFKPTFLYCKFLIRKHTETAKQLLKDLASRNYSPAQFTLSQIYNDEMSEIASLMLETAASNRSLKALQMYAKYYGIDCHPFLFRNKEAKKRLIEIKLGTIFYNLDIVTRLQSFYVKFGYNYQKKFRNSNGSHFLINLMDNGDYEIFELIKILMMKKASAAIRMEIDKLINEMLKDSLLGYVNFFAILDFVDQYKKKFNFDVTSIAKTISKLLLHPIKLGELFIIHYRQHMDLSILLIKWAECLDVCDYKNKFVTIISDANAILPKGNPSKLLSYGEISSALKVFNKKFRHVYPSITYRFKETGFFHYMFAYSQGYAKLQLN